MSSDTGYTVMKRPMQNKGNSFSDEELRSKKLRGLVPGGEPIPLDLKVEITMSQLR